MTTVISIKLPLSCNARPYTVLGEQIDGEAVARFVVDVREDEADEPDWEETPIPRPLQVSPALVGSVAEKISELGFTLVTRPFTVH